MRFVWICLLVTVTACSHDVRVRYPAPPDAPTGTLVLLFGEAAGDVAVAINGQLMCEGEHTDRVTIDNVPVGTAKIVMAANGADKQFEMWIDGDHPTTVPLGVPDAGNGFVKTLFGTIVTIVLYSLLH
jgi:hypothetical protein